MGNLQRSSVAGWAVMLGVILLLTLAACSTDDNPGEGNGAPDSGGSEMRLTANGCTADCTFANGEEFTLAVELVAIPAGGYISAQSFIDFGPDLIYDAEAAAAIDEIVLPDCDPAIAVSSQFSPTSIYHGCLTGLIPPLPVSTFVGNIVEIAFTCSSDSSTTEVRLLPENDPFAGTSGTTLVGTDISIHFVPQLTDLTIICGG